MTDDKLLPCPFCGAEAHVRKFDDGGIEIDVSHDDQCIMLALVDDMTFHENMERRAVSMWNTRAERTCEYIGDEISGGCSECRGWLDPACAYCPSCGARVIGG